MTIDPTPSPDEIAAIIVAIERRMRANAVSTAPRKPSRWRMAGREYTNDLKR